MEIGMKEDIASLAKCNVKPEVAAEIDEAVPL